MRSSEDIVAMRSPPLRWPWPSKLPVYRLSAPNSKSDSNGPCLAPMTALLLLPKRAALLGPLVFDNLPCAAEGQRVGGHRVGDDRACAQVSACADFDGGHQGGVTADERAVPDACGVFLKAVVIAGNRACADVGGSADLGVAQVCQMAGFGASAHAGFLELDE